MAIQHLYLEKVNGLTNKLCNNSVYLFKYIFYINLMKFFFIILFFVFYSFLLKAECTKGVCTNGTGVYEFDNGDKYIGQFNNSEYDGKGTFRFSSGDVYTGNFKNGKYSGLGVYQYSDGSIYSGDYIKIDKNDVFIHMKNC